MLAHCTVSGNIVEDNSGGGGIATEAMGANTTTTIIDSAIVNNATQGTRSGGGAVIAFGLVGGSTKLINSTLSGNTVGNDGGAISIYSSGNTLSLTNCTISGNTAVTSGGGVFAYSGAGVEINNTIIAGNTQGQPGHEFDGNYTGSNNLIGGNALLAPLGDYGGTTKTMPLLPGSPAIGAGSISLTVDAGGNPLTSDQRGESRTLNGKVDIGAFESQGFTINAVAGSTPQTALIGSAFANPLAITITGNNPNEPVNGGLVVYTATPASNGASAIFANSTILIANGQASIIAAPNNDDGWYSVVASVGGSTTTFQLTNAGATFSHLVVNTTSDSLAPGLGLLSLREAIALDNASLSGNTPITFDSIVFSQAKTITLGGSQLELSNTLGTLTITAPAAGVTISGGGVSRVFQIDSGVTVDLNGLKIRVMETPLYVTEMKSLGAQPTPVAWPETYTALQTGVVDGHENVIPSIVNAKIFEVQKHVTLDGHNYGVDWFVMSDKFFKSLTPALQKVVQDAGKAACVEERRVNRALTADGVKSLKDKGVTVYTPQAAEIAQFKAATQKPVIDWLKTKVDQKWIDAVLVAVKDAEAKK